MNHPWIKGCVILFLVALILPASLSAQAPDYPKHYFRNPLSIPILLAGNFGECRPGHFHSGIDIKTGGHENEPVFAAADGYISRVKMEPGGFGHGLYITHPNGYTTLYAHLSKFMPAIQEYVRRQQYAKESWTVDLSFNPDQFPVKQGDQIAWSGNTGSSTAPHLHFEIRNSKTEHPLNPELFGLAVSDTRAPVPLQLALYDSAFSIYEQPPKLLPLKKKGASYGPIPDTVFVTTGSTGLGLEVNDFMDGSDNTLAFYTAEWYVDDVLQGRIRLDDIGYDVSRYVNAYADYKTKQISDAWIQCLFRLPGNELDGIYESLNDKKGIIALPDDVPHRIRITLTDDAGNASEVRFSLRQSEAPHSRNCDQLFTPGKINRFSDPNLIFSLDENALYDAVCFQFTKTRDDKNLSNRYQLHRAYVPVHAYFGLQLKPNKPVSAALRNKVAMVCNDGKEDDGKAATPVEKGWYKASVRNLGEYRLVADTTAPVIKALTSFKGNLAMVTRISFMVKEEITSVKSFRGELDDQWILFEQHGNTWFYEMDDHCPKGVHTLVVTATDENGNKTSQRFTFTR